MIMTSLTVFLDLGGIIIDKEQKRAQWQALVGGLCEVAWRD
jgi:hypothetical protein